jgi:hypothetical protein
MLTRPKPIFDLDNAPESSWRIREGVMYIYRNDSWTYEPVGCILCAKADRKDARGQTLKSDNNNHYHCLTHGDLEEVPYSVERITKIKMGTLTKEVVQNIDQFVLFPKDLAQPAREIIFNDLINVIAEEEVKNEADDTGLDD